VALTTDHLPHLHELAPGLWAGLGYNGRGVGMATVMGSLLAEQALRGSAAEHPFPVTRLQPIPFHGLRQPALAAAIMYYRIKDRLGFPSN
jgi:glycine/D-amino acid oxidase-like deaminating enzyme